MSNLIKSKELFFGLLLQIGDPRGQNVLALVDVMNQIKFVFLQTFLELREDWSAIAISDPSRRTLKNVKPFPFHFQTLLNFAI